MGDYSKHDYYNKVTEKSHNDCFLKSIYISYGNMELNILMDFKVEFTLEFNKNY